jgi:hypothetical protein
MIKILEYTQSEEKVDVRISINGEESNVEIPHEEFNHIQFINELVNNSVLTEEQASNIFELSAQLNHMYFNMGQMVIRQQIENEIIKHKNSASDMFNGNTGEKKTDSGIILL